MSDEAVSLNVYVNSLASHSPRALEIPAPKHGIINPWGYPDQKGIRAWRSEWQVPPAKDPSAESGQPAGLRILPVSTTGGAEPYYAAVAGKTLGIYVWDAANSGILSGEFYVQVVAVFRDKQTKKETFQPAMSVFPNATFGCPVSNSHCSSLGATNIPQLPPPTSASAEQKAPPNMYRYHLTTLTFSDFQGDQFEGVDLIKLHIAVFMRIDGANGSVYFFDDPEMDVNNP